MSEYIVWQVYENRVDWFQLQEGQYVLLQPDEQGIIRSQIFPGLWLATRALCQSNRAELSMVLQKGLQSMAHQEFVKRLNPDR